MKKDDKIIPEALYQERTYTVGLIMFGITILLFILLSPAMTLTMLRYETIVIRLINRQNLKEVGIAFQNYAADFDGRLPTSENWCDLLIIESKLTPELLCHHWLETGESLYVLNKYIADSKLSDIPPDTVLLFDNSITWGDDKPEIPLKDRKFVQSYDPRKLGYDPNLTMVQKDLWNQIGGPEFLILDERYQDGCNVLFADSTARWLPTHQIPDLKWKPDGSSPLLPENLARTIQQQPNWHKITPIALTLLLVLPALSTILIILKYRTTKCWIFATVLAIVAAAIGALLGSWAQFLYSPHTSIINGFSSGVFFGLLCAFGYTFLVFGIASKLKSPVKMGSWAIILGVLTGAICSTLVHATLIITTRVNIYFLLIMGLPFGTIAGLILGAITAIVLNHQINKTNPAPTGGQ